MADLAGLHAAPNEALRVAVERIGGQNATARLLKVAQPSVWRWLKNGKLLPAEHVLLIEASTGVSKHDLRPDIYPRPAVGTDGEVAR